MTQTRLAIAIGLLSAVAGNAVAEEWGPWPEVIFTTGKQWTTGGPLLEDHMTGISDMLANEYDAMVRSNSWNCFRDGAREFDQGCPTNDANFLRDIGTNLNGLPEGRPVILIGHSYGGDSLLKAVNGANDIGRTIERPITALIVLDPVSTGGQRQTRHSFYNGVPAHVGWFYNRWQQNAPLPFNFLDSGQLDRTCYAGTCDEAEQKFQRLSNGSTIDVNCGPRFSLEKGAYWGCDALKSTHGSLVTDGQLTSQILAGLRSRLNSRRIVTLKNVNNSRFLVTEGGGGPGSVVNANRTTALQWEHLEIKDLNGGSLLSGDPVTLATYNGFYVSAQPDGTVVADRTRAGQWETLYIHTADNTGSFVDPGDRVFFTTVHNTTLALATDNTSVVAAPSTACTENRCKFQIDGRTQ